MGRLTALKPRIPTMHKPRGGWQDERRGSSTERGYGAGWQRLRGQVMRRDAGMCQPCLRRQQVTLGHAVDHIVNKARGGGDDLANLQCICNPCHMAKTAAEARGLEWDECDPRGDPGVI